MDKLSIFGDVTTTESDHSRTSSGYQGPNSNSQPSYGRDLWDCLSVLNESTTQRTFFMKSMRSFFQQYKKGLDQFAQQMNKALNQYEKDFVKVRQDHIIDTMSTAMVNVKMCFDEMAKAIQDKSDQVQCDMVEPLELYFKHYGQTNNELLKQGNLFWNTLHQERTQMLFSKENYYNQVQIAQSFQIQYQELNSNPQRKPSEESNLQYQERKLQLQQQKAELSKVEYERSLTKLNSTIDQFETVYKPILNRIQEADERQINQVKLNMEKLAKNIESMGANFKQRGEEILQTVGQISSETDIKILIETNKSTNPFIQKEEFQPFEGKADMIGNLRGGSFKASDNSIINQFESPPVKGLFKSTPQASKKKFFPQNDNKEQTDEQSEYELLSKDAIEQDKEKVFNQMMILLEGVNTIALEEKGNLIQLMQNKMMRNIMTEILNEINSPKSIQNYNSMKIIADILKFILTLFVHEQANDFRLLYTIIESSQNIYSYHNNRKQYLSSLLQDHEIWHDTKSWNECLTEIIQMKIEDANRRRRNSKQGFSLEGTQQKERNFFKKGLHSIKGMLSSKQQNDKHQDLKINQNLIFNELSRFVQSSINFGFPYNEAHALLVKFCDQYQIEQTRIHLLLTELQSNQKTTENMFTDQEQLIWSLSKRGNRLKAFGFNDSTQILGMTIKFLDQDSDLRNILLLSRDFHELLREEVYKQALLRSSQQNLKKKRLTLWLKILRIDPNKSYQEFIRFQAQALYSLPKLVSDAIEVDVNRSFNSLKLITALNLNNILKTYAIVNPELDYCQGMNFIAGFLYLITKEEHLAYSVMKEVIEKFNMGNLFNPELPMLKLNFYQLDRLISIILSDLHTHFKEEAISSSYYSSPYFITLFTSVLQMQTTETHQDKLLRFWDYFIINGWKSIFKVSLLILKENEEQLLNMPFEVMLTQIVNMPIKFFISDSENQEDEDAAVTRFDKKMGELKIPTMLLERLKKEFDVNYHISKQTSHSEGSNLKPSNK